MAVPIGVINRVFPETLPRLSLENLLDAHLVGDQPLLESPEYGESHRVSVDDFARELVELLQISGGRGGERRSGRG